MRLLRLLESAEPARSTKAMQGAASRAWRLREAASTRANPRTASHACMPLASSSCNASACGAWAHAVGMGMRHGHVAWACGMGIRHGHGEAHSPP